MVREICLTLKRHQSKTSSWEVTSKIIGNSNEGNALTLENSLSYPLALGDFSRGPMTAKSVARTDCGAE